jgi:hypothetical protein
LPEATDVTQELLRVGVELLNDNLPVRPAPIRLLGFGVHGLEQATAQPTPIRGAGSEQAAEGR